MTTATTGSVFPPSIDDLVPRVRARAVELGAPLSRNRVMREFGVGAAKARAVLDALAGTEVDPATRPEVSPGRLLHAVTTPTLTPQEPTDPDPTPSAAGTDPTALVTPVVNPGPEITPGPIFSDEEVEALIAELDAAPHPDHDQADRDRAGRVRGRWTLVLLALPAFVAIWSGWVGLGMLTGFGPVHLLPGIADGFVFNSAITLPIGVEAYAAFALRVWLTDSSTIRARRFAKRSAIGSLVLGAAGQVAYHLMSAAGVTKAPWPVTTLVSCLPVIVLGCAAGLAHLIREGGETQ
jgi:hypothetical protein